VLVATQSVLFIELLMRREIRLNNSKFGNATHFYYDSQWIEIPTLDKDASPCLSTTNVCFTHLNRNYYCSLHRTLAMTESAPRVFAFTDVEIPISSDGVTGATVLSGYVGDATSTSAYWYDGTLANRDHNLAIDPFNPQDFEHNFGLFNPAHDGTYNIYFFPNTFPVESFCQATSTEAVCASYASVKATFTRSIGTWSSSAYSNSTSTAIISLQYPDSTSATTTTNVHFKYTYFFNDVEDYGRYTHSCAYVKRIDGSPISFCKPIVCLEILILFSAEFLLKSA